MVRNLIHNTIIEVSCIKTNCGRCISISIFDVFTRYSHEESM